MIRSESAIALLWLAELFAITNRYGSGSEATEVIENFEDLSTTQQQDILDFLRSL